MRCSGCGFNVAVDDAPSGRRCNACGSHLIFESDDFLLRQHGAPGRDVRVGQVQMGRMVEQVIREHGIALIEAPVGCHGAGTKILMYDGTFKRVEKIAVGDRLCGDDGQPREVLKLIRGEAGDLVTITPSKGIPWTATLDHVLTVVDGFSGQVRDVVLRDWLSEPPVNRMRCRLLRCPANFVERDDVIPLEPYFLGNLLSDTTETYSIIRRRQKLGSWRNSCLRAVLDMLRLADCHAWERRVPQHYKTGSRETRLKFLAGLLDSGGFLREGSYVYSCRSKHLARDLVFMARSVGLVADCTVSEQTFFVDISGDISVLPSHVSRGNKARRGPRKRWLHVEFSVSGTSVIKPFYGFTLTGNGRYLLEDFTVTHNSGKSDAYGVPAVITASPDSGYTLKGYQGSLPLRVAEQKKLRPRIVISTAKKNLQHQIAEKDLPFIRKRHGEDYGPIDIALLKGKSNYACRLKAEITLEGAERATFLSWLSRTPGEDLSDFPGKRPPYLFDVTAEDCVGKSCKYAKQASCGYWNAKLNAAKASILVANHSVVAFDLRFGPCAIIGPYTTLILDEAHQAPASFRSAFSSSVVQGGVIRTIRQMDSAGISGGFDSALQKSWKAMFEVLASSEGEIPRNPFGDLGVETNHILTEVDKAAYDNAVSLGWSSDPGFDIDSIEDEDDRSQLLAIYALRKTIERTNETLARSITPDENTVLYVTTTERGFKKLTLAPISVGKLVGPKLQMIPSVVITSATMAVGGKFEDIKYQLGLTRSYYRDDAGAAHIPKQIHELVLSTPFNYDKQALLYTPRHIPLPVGASDPRRSAYISVVVNECTRLIRASDGNAFILFTSKQDLLDVYAGLQEEDLPNPLIIQDDDASNTLRTYMMTPKSVLLGVKSFWEGVDVQGSKLQLVIITKLPFPPVTDPVLQARSRQLIAEQVACGIPAETAKSSVFSRLQIPYMLTELRQGAGRLIRARTDKGVLAILDSRIFTGNSKDMPLPNQQSYKGYGKLVAEATGFNNHVFEFEIVRRVFEQWNTRNAAA